MKTSPVSRISASIPLTKKSKFNLSHDVNTTYDWGSVQPLFGKMLQPDSSINVNIEQLTRLAPMVVPTFGRVKMKNIAHFVPMQEIWPNWDAMMSRTKVSRPSLISSDVSSNTYVPQFVPNVNVSILAAMCLVGSKVNLYFSDAVGTVAENTWYCARNTGTYSTPAGWTTATTAVRDFLYTVLDIKTTNSPTTVTLTDFNYTGYDFTARRLPLLSDNKMLLPYANAAVLRLPTISTLVPFPLINANGQGYTHSAGNEKNSYDSTLGDDHISFDGSDMIWEFAGSDGTGIKSSDRASGSGYPVEGINSTFFDGKKVRLVFKLSSFGKRLRKILIGLGYDVNLSSQDVVSILPLIAFYKAWWDSYAPERFKNFYETSCWKLINACLGTATAPQLFNSFAVAYTSNPITEYFRQFIADLGTCFATEKMDVISAATDKYYNSTGTTDDPLGNTSMQNSIAAEVYRILENPTYNYGGDIVNADGSENLDFFMTTNGGYNRPSGTFSLHDRSSSLETSITQPQIDALKKAYVMMNKSSVAGMRVEEILRALGYGDYIEECRGKFINGSDSPIKISDVVATSDTYDESTDTGSQLGQYGGRGLGFDKMQFSFNTNRFGYLVILSSIVPESGYINAPIHENEAFSFDTMYNPEFDGLAYEAIQKKNLLGSPLVNDSTGAATFGFLPTYTQWKFMSNKANGDFSLNSMKKNMLPYTLDKYIPVSNIGVYRVEETNGHAGSTTELCSPTFKYSDLPNAGEDWRFVNKFPWNGNYNRIFSAVGDGFEWSVFSPNNNAFLYDSFEFDNFMTHNVIDVSYWAHMKSIEDSYGTYDEEHGAPNSSIKKS